MYALDKEVIEPRKGIVLNVKKDSTITLKSFPNGILSATYLLENEYTNTFATQVDVSSEIKQTADSITEQVNAKVGDDEIIAKLNLGIQEGQGIINMTGNQVTIDSDNFTLDAEGNVNCNNATMTNANIVNGSISLTQEQSSTTLPIKINQTSSSGDNYETRIGSAGIQFFKNGNYRSRLVTTTSPQSYTGLYLYDENNTNVIHANSRTGNITCVSLTQTSKEESKKNFEKLNSGLNIIKNIDIYKYNLINENDDSKKHIGFVIGNDYKYSSEITALDEEGNEVGVDLYSMTSVCLQAIKEQQEIIEDLQKRIEALERESDK
jgi:hypothetical protein